MAISHRKDCVNDPRPTSFGVNLIGHLSITSGIGEAGRGYGKALERLGWRIGYGNIAPPQRVDAGLEEWSTRDLSAKNRVNLHVLNPYPSQVYEVERQVGFEILKQSYNIGSWWWELGQPPACWQKEAHLFDEVWAGSAFLAQIFENSFDLPVKLAPVVVSPAPSALITRNHFGLSDDEIVYLFVCDLMSTPQRKNPMGVISAFKNAFRKDDPARLVIKVHSPGPHSRELDELKAASADARITLIDARLARSELDSLLALADCYVSLHRSEGFGLTLAESMFLEKPVVGTAYSGNLDFMREDNSYLVPFQMVEVERTAGPYRKGLSWADPNLEKAGEILRDIAENYDAAREKGVRGSQTIKASYSVDAVGAKISALLPEELFSSERRSSRFWNLTSNHYTGAGAAEARRPLQFPSASGHAKPKISVCLPVINGSDFLAQAIESVLDQTFTDFELIIADDASTDESAEIIEHYASKDQRIRSWSNPSRLGIFNNYNRCMEQACGTYIKPFAQDDLLHSDYLQMAVTCMQFHPEVSLFACRRILIDEYGIELHQEAGSNQHRLPFGKRGVISGDEAIKHCLMPVVNHIGEPASVMFPRRILGPGFDSDFYHLGDLEFWIRLLDSGSLYFSTEKKSLCRRHGASTTTDNLKSMLFALDLLRLGRKHEETLLSLGISWDSYRDMEIGNIRAQVEILTQGDLFFGARAIENGMGPDCLLAFRELAFYAFRSRVWSQQQYSSQELTNNVSNMERQIRKLIESKSWAGTKALRDLNRKLGWSGSLTEEEILQGAVKTTFSDYEYLIYLAKLQASILRSRSWTITAPLRQMGWL